MPLQVMSLGRRRSVLLMDCLMGNEQPAVRFALARSRRVVDCCSWLVRMIVACGRMRLRLVDRCGRCACLVVLAHSLHPRSAARRRFGAMLSAKLLLAFPIVPSGARMRSAMLELPPASVVSCASRLR